MNMRSLAPIILAPLVAAAVAGCGGGGGSSSSGLVSYWPADGTFVDVVGGHDGFPSGGVSFAVGQIGQSFDIDGSSGRITVGDPPALALTHSLAITAWIRPQGDTSDLQVIMFRGDDRAGHDPYALFLNPNGTLTFRICDTNGNETSINSPAAIPLNAWTFVGVSLDDSNGHMSIYLNGVLVSSSTTSIRPFAALDSTRNPGVGIGNSQSANYNVPFDGLIDELKIYNQPGPASQSPS